MKQLVELRGLSSYDGAKKVKGQELPIPVDDPEFIRIREGVEAHNAFAAGFTVEGCTPPRFYRIFTGGWQLHGRWYAAGADQTTVYLHMPERERLKLRISGEAVAEVDVSASHLSILHGLFGFPLPDGDLYSMVPGVPRGAVKAWLTITLGRGKAKPKWSDETPEKHRLHDAGLICAKMVEAYPFLTKLDEIVPADVRAAHSKGAHSLPSLVLQGIEAKALTGAMEVLRNRGILALPTHDGLIVPASAAEEAKEAFKGSFGYFAKIQPRLDVEPKERV
ncbi:hypothetical protein [Teichococcus aestuarii]|uniref:hypothetical protein n=1 Tax=Teichococcus aestuarii TaxID=568898 RepID=UPI0011B2848D|nr:hypothetical protein [Pseudoroseomonas aestuarii]